MRFLCVLLLLFQVLLQAEEILIVEQEYNIVQQDKDGATGKDIRQRIYMSKQMVKIDEFAGSGRLPTETYLLDLENEQIVNLDNENGISSTESFKRRKERIEARKEKARADLAEIQGPQHEKLKQLYRQLLDDERVYKHDRELEPKTRRIADVDAERVRILDEKEPQYVPFTASLHPETEVPYDSAEVLYLLQLIGKNMAQYLRDHRQLFRRLPMEMELDLAAGGTLRTKVTKIEKVDRNRLDENFFSIPKDGFKEKPLTGGSRFKKDKPVEPD